VISQNFSWWNRRGMEVIRGHTTLLLVGKEILYVEPIFLRSQQNHVPQLKKVIVVFRGKPFLEDTLEQAVKSAVAWTAAHPDEAPPPVPSWRFPSVEADLKEEEAMWRRDRTIRGERAPSTVWSFPFLPARCPARRSSGRRESGTSSPTRGFSRS
jgi:uncharacterized membrane protein (UPF0182 family)